MRTARNTLAVLAIAVAFAGGGTGASVTRPEAQSSAGPRAIPTYAIGGMEKPTPPAPPSAPVSKCDPNYSGCVPIASDVDCMGGKGNGPAYVRGPVTVKGSDIYGLDGDGDGIGCER